MINVHNPADVHGPAAKWRAEAIARERTVIARERAAGYPVFLVGDLNDREEAFCGVADGGLMVSASGGSNAGACQPPKNMNIDWIFGTGAAFSGYLVDQSPQGRTSDHPYVEAVATAASTS